MKKSILAICAFAALSLMSSCTGDDAVTENNTLPQVRVSKMTVTDFAGQPEAQFSGTFEFTYDENRQVTSILKKSMNATGEVIENTTLTYLYDGNFLTSYSAPNFTTLEVSYDDSGRMLNLGFGSDMEYYPNGDMKKDCYGRELLYLDNNFTGTADAPDLYTYDDHYNPFARHNPHFSLIFDEQFEAYFSTMHFRVPNNILEEADPQGPIVHIMQYDANGFPVQIINKYANATEILERFDFEYITQ